MTRSRDVSAVQNNLGVAIPPAAAGKNAVINGGFDIWQRGTSFSNPTSVATAYSADRWVCYRAAGFTTGVTISRQTTSDTTNLPNIQYCARVQRTAGNTSTVNTYLANNFETVNSIPMAGKIVTLSFYARKGADFSGTFSAEILTGTGTDQNIINGLTGSATIASSAFTLTTTWQRFTVTGTIGSTATQIVPHVFQTPSGTASTNDYFEITGVQLEVGATATSFQTATGAIAGELTACKRYYERQTATSTQGYAPYGTGYFNFATAAVYPYKWEVEKRTQPTVSFGPSVNQFMAGYNGNQGQSAVTLTAANITKHTCYITLVPSGTPFTQGQATTLQDAGSATSYIEISAEL
jgi:hypothetical protein